MRQLQISDQLYQDILRRAKDNGFDDVEDYVTDMLEQDAAETEKFRHVFTPERLAEIAEAAADMDAGKGVPAEEVHEYFRRKSGIK